MSAYKLQMQQKSDLAKSGSGRILHVGYPNPVSGIWQNVNIRPSLVHTYLCVHLCVHARMCLFVSVLSLNISFSL